MEQAVKSQPLFDVGIPIPLIEDPTMRFLALVACVALTFTALDMSAVERCSPNTGGSVWIEGSWQQCGGQHTWRPGYWQATQTTTTVYTTPSTTWIEGHWAQGANGSVWVEGHYQQAPAICTTGTTVVYNPPPQVVYVQPRPCPQTTVVVNGGYYGGYYGGYQRPVCRPVSPHVTVGVAVPLPVPRLPRLSIGHVNHIPIPVPVFHRR
jgi:hypothetical protein